MIIENNRIVECTEPELMEYYLTRGYDDIMSFLDFKREFRDAGCIIME